MRFLSRPARRVRLAVALVALAGVTASTTAASGATHQAPAADPLTVFAAASLTDVFPYLDSRQRYSFAGSDTLAAQIRLGAPADVFAAASPDAPQALFKAGIVDRPVTFATNKLVIIVPKGNPAGIHSVFDLRKPGIKLVVGTPTVPIGAYTRQVLANIGISKAVLANVVSQERDVRTIVAKLALGVGDAGFAYVTDQRVSSGQVSGIAIPAWAQPPVRYQIALVSKSGNKTAGQAFIKKLLGTTGRKALVKYGFGVPKLPASGT
jgi:molybdate transport system substrate-binding protein